MEPKKTRAKGAGRKPLQPEDRAKSMSIRLPPVQHQKLLALGGIVWLREQIEKAELIE